MPSQNTFSIVLRIFDDDRAEVFESSAGPPSAPLTEEAPDSGYTLTFLDAAGSTLVESPFPVSFTTPHLAEPQPSTVVGIVRPLPAETAAVEAHHDARVLARVARQPNGPALGAVSVIEGKDVDGPAVDVFWDATGGDAEDALTFAVSYALGGSEDFVPIVGGLRTPSTRIPLLPGFPGGSDMVIKVVASDGFDVAEALSAPYPVPVTPPVAAITSPSSSAVLAAGRELGFSGTGFDPQSGLLGDAALEWWLVEPEAGNDLFLGTGRDIATKALPPGRHRIRLVASGPDGQHGIDEREIVIVDEPTDMILRMTKVRAPDVNFVFSKSGEATAADVTADFRLAGTEGSGFLQAREWQEGEKGTPGAGLTASLYRVALDGMVDKERVNGVVSLRVDVGPVQALRYSEHGDADVFVVTEGGLGHVGPSLATQLGSIVTLSFDPPVRGGDGNSPGQSSFFIGIARRGSATGGVAVLTDVSGAQYELRVHDPGKDLRDSRAGESQRAQGDGAYVRGALPRS